METFLTQFFLKRLKDWRSVVGLLALLFAVFESMIGLSPYVPAWIWWLAAVVSPHWELFDSERKKFAEKKEKIQPDMALEAVVKRIIGTEKILEGDNCGKTFDALLQIRDRAHLGEIAVWGRKDPHCSDLALSPVTQIAAEYWG